MSFVKLCPFLNAWFSYFAFKSTYFVQVLEKFAHICASACLQLLEALSPLVYFYLKFINKIKCTSKKEALLK